MTKLPVLLAAGSAAVLLLCGSTAGTSDPLRQAAESGKDPAAQVKLGREFFTGVNRPGNLARAAWWFRRAAEAGYPDGRFHYGVCLEFGWGVDKNVHAALQEYRGAMELPQARFRIAHLLRHGIPAGQDKNGMTIDAVAPAPELAQRELRQLAAENYVPAQLELAKWLYSDRKKHESEAPEIRRLALSAAAAAAPPVPEAKLFAYRLLQQGFGGPVDEKQALAHLKAAVELKYPPAITQLALLYDNAPGFRSDPARAIELLRRAAAVNEPQALCILGDKHLAGEGVAHDPAMAKKYFSLAVKAGYPAAFSRLGDCYMYGFGTAADAARAVEEYEKGARAGDPESQCRLGRAYLNGTGVAADPTAAVFWFKCAGSSGNAAAVRELALALLAGKGIKKDTAEGMRLLRAAAESGDNIAAGMLNR